MSTPSQRMGLPIPGGTDIHNLENFARLIEEIDAKSARKQDLDSHEADKSNPHGVTAHQAGSYTKAEIDSKDTTIKNDLAGHKSNKANPHGVTTEQINTYTKGVIDQKDNGIQTDLNGHKNNTANPHGVTAPQVGLGNVQNLGVASQTEAEAGASNTKYMTPLRSKQLLDTHGNLTNNPHGVTASQAGAYTKAETDGKVSTAQSVVQGNLNTHTGNKTNPHGVTASQVGAYTKAETDSKDSTIQTDLTGHKGNTQNPHGVTAGQVGTYTKAEIDSKDSSIQGNLNTHIASRNNPHNVTASQVGLGNVQNYGMATQAEAQAGTTDTKYMTPLRTKQAIDQHGNLTNNPHGVTAGQVGAYTKTETNSAITGGMNNIQGNLDVHTGARNNPHNVTASQVGAYTKTETDRKMGEVFESGSDAERTWVKFKGDDAHFDGSLHISGGADNLNFKSTEPNGHGYISWIGSDDILKGFMGFGSPQYRTFTIGNDSGGDLHLTTSDGGRLMFNHTEIITSGSNSNGYFYKYSNGQMFCIQRMIVGGTSTAWGSMFYAHLSPLNWTFPNAFLESPSLSMGSDQNSHLIATEVMDGISARGMHILRPSGITYKGYVTVTATGRWR